VGAVHTAQHASHLLPCTVLTAENVKVHVMDARTSPWLSCCWYPHHHTRSLGVPYVPQCLSYQTHVLAYKALISAGVPQHQHQGLTPPPPPQNTKTHSKAGSWTHPRPHPPALLPPSTGRLRRAAPAAQWCSTKETGPGGGGQAGVRGAKSWEGGLCCNRPRGGIGAANTKSCSTCHATSAPCNSLQHQDPSVQHHEKV